MRRFGVAVVAIGFGLWPGWLEPAEAERPGLPHRVEEVLWWLAQDTQTFVIAHGPFDEERFLDRRDFLSRLGLQCEEKDGPLAGRSIALAVKGGRRFRAPKGLGAWLHQGADIVVYDKPLGGAGEALKKSLMDREDSDLFDVLDIKVEKIHGHDVIVTREKEGEDVGTTLVTQPLPDVMIYATDRSYLAETLARLRRRAKDRALPAHLPEWRVLDVAKPIWAIRHYDHKDLADDPSSPRSVINDGQGTGLVFEFTPAKDRVATVKYLTGHKDAVTLMKSVWLHPQEKTTPTIRSGEPGVVEIAMPIEGPAGQRESGAMFFLLLNSLLGYSANL
jgi:hypothetical protein